MTRPVFALALFLVPFLLSEARAQRDKPLKVFVLAGQSNMVGKRSRIGELPRELQGEQKNVLFFDGRKWGPLAAGNTEPEGFGPEISFGYRMSREWREPIGIVKHSVGGTNLAVNWSPSIPTSLYAQMLRKVRAARKERRIEIVGMVWMQGESDGRDPRMAQAYAGNLRAFVRRARADLRSPALIFVAGRVNPPKQGFPFVDIVRAAQERCKEKNYGFIDCDSLEKGPDNLHYTTRGVVDMGYDFADAIIKVASRSKTGSHR